MSALAIFSKLSMPNWTVSRQPRASGHQWWGFGTHWLPGRSRDLWCPAENMAKPFLLEICQSDDENIITNDKFTFSNPNLSAVVWSTWQFHHLSTWTFWIYLTTALLLHAFNSTQEWNCTVKQHYWEFRIVTEWSDEGKLIIFKNIAETHASSLVHVRTVPCRFLLKPAWPSQRGQNFANRVPVGSRTAFQWAYSRTPKPRSWPSVPSINARLNLCQSPSPRTLPWSSLQNDLKAQR
jgi:hypothetical protein